MDNCIFASAGAHLARCQPCAPRPAPVVSRAGTKAMPRSFLWISTRLCQNYPQFYAPSVSAAGNARKTKGSGTASCPECSLIDSKWVEAMLSLLGCKGSDQACGTGPSPLAKADGVPHVVGALHPLVRHERHRPPTAPSFAASQGCERSTGQDRTG